MGKARFVNGNEYVGQFRDGLFSSKGQLTYKDIGDGAGPGIYVGNFRGQKREGYGEMTWGNSRGSNEGEIYKGLWHNDRRIKGWIRMADGTLYDGEWKDDMMHGSGRLTFKPETNGSKGIIYEGRFVEGIQECEGKLIYPNGDLYKGQIL